MLQLAFPANQAKGMLYAIAIDSKSRLQMLLRTLDFLEHSSDQADVPFARHTPRMKIAMCTHKPAQAVVFAFDCCDTLHEHLVKMISN